MCTQRLRDHFRNIELTLLVGICGAMSENGETGEAIYLGDVIVGTQGVAISPLMPVSNRSLHGVQTELRNLTGGCFPTSETAGNLLTTESFRDETIACSLNYLKFLQERKKNSKYLYPVTEA